MLPNRYSENKAFYEFISPFFFILEEIFIVVNLKIKNADN